MKGHHRLRNCALAACVIVATGAARATAGEVVDSVVTTASGVVVKVEQAVRRGVKAAAEGVEHGAKVAGATADKVARKVGLPASGAAPAAPTRPH